MEGAKKAFLIDPGTNPEWILEAIEEQGLELDAVLITHGHADHIGGLTAIKEKFPGALVYVGIEDAPKLTSANENLSAMFGFPITVPAADKLLSDGDKFTVAGIPIKAFHIPGHSAGHMVYLLEADDGPIVFVGDVIFKQSVGRTDFPDGNSAQLLKGIREKIYTLPEATVLFCGHGPETTVGSERRFNPFCSPRD